MDSILDTMVGNIVSKSLDMLLVRHQVIANNIANVDTQGYRAKKVDFEQVLGDVVSRVRSGSISNVDQLRTSLKSMGDHIQIEDQDQSKVVLDKEIVALTQNTINYQALLTANREFGSILSTAIKGGKQ